MAVVVIDLCNDLVDVKALLEVNDALLDDVRIGLDRPTSEDDEVERVVLVIYVYRERERDYQHMNTHTL